MTQRGDAMAMLRPTLLYFALVFGAGFALGLVRVPWLVPRFGERIALAIEAPFLLVAIALAARFVTRRHPAPARRHLAVGLGAAALVLAADLAVGIGLRGMTPAQVFLDRDPVTGTAYYALLTAFAAAPALLRPRPTSPLA